MKTKLILFYVSIIKLNQQNNQSIRQDQQMQTQLMGSDQLRQWQQGSLIDQKNKKFLSKIKRNQKQKSLTYIQSIQRKSRPSSSTLTTPVKEFQIVQSINQLKNIEAQEKSKNSKIINRLKYLKTAKQRQQKLTTTAKQKFYKINQIRKQSFSEKSSFTKERETFLYQHSKTVYIQASKIKNQKNKASDSQKKIQFQKHTKALEVKKQRQLNESLIKERSQHEKSQRKARMDQIQKQAKLARKKCQSRSRQESQQSAQNLKRNILNQYQKVQQQLVIFQLIYVQKINKKLISKFQSKAVKIYEKKLNQQQKLKQYRSLLGLNKSEMNIKGFKQLQQERKQKLNSSMIKKQLNSKPYLKTASSMKRSSPHIQNKNYLPFKSNRNSMRKFQDQGNGSGFYLTNPER